MKKFLLIIAIFLTNILIANAASISVSAPKSSDINQNISVLVNLDTDSTSINSFDITLSYPNDLVSFKGYKEEGSINKLWISQPKDIGGAINFSGVIPGGVDGVYDPEKGGIQPIPLITLLFSTTNEGSGDFIIKNSNVLKNDGLGTTLSYEVNNSSIVISKLESKNSDESKVDINPPEPFEIQYIPAGLFSKTPPIIIFSATDKESGIEKYQMKTLGHWKEVTSPKAVSRNLLKKDIRIRAIDFSGNIRESSIDIPGFISNTQLLLIVLGILICYYIYITVKRKR